MDPDRLAQQIEFLVETDKLKQVFRQTWLVDQSRRENDAEHSWHLALMVLLLAEYANAPGLDLLRVLKMVLVHDLVEIDAGDTFVYDDEGAKDKEIIIQATLFSDKLEIALRDFGKKVPKDKIVSRPLEHIRPGGLGVYFINEIMDKVEYDTSPKLGTILRLVKYRHKQSKDRGE